MELTIKKGNHPLGQGDPYILEDNGCYYVFATGYNGVSCYKATELMGEYEYLGDVFSVEGHKEYWAPAVLKIEDKYYMYVSFMKNESHDVHTQALCVAISDNVAGPYKFNNYIAEPFSIDAHPVLNENGLYMFYSLNDYEAEKAGTRIVLDKMVSPTELAGKPEFIVEPTLEQEIFMKNRFKEGQDWYTIEGACYFYESGYHYLLYSANCYGNEYYFVGYAVCESEELDLTKLGFVKQPNSYEYKPLLSQNEYESGTGHNTVIKVDGQWYIVYHGRTLKEVTEHDNRTMRIAKLEVNGKNLKVIR